MDKKKKNDDERDKISDLPDPILHHIFSFLKMEEAVRSSVFSKRWRHLWTSLPTLNFKYEVIITSDDEMRGGIQRFILCDDVVLEDIAGLIDKVFNLRDASSNIQRFSLICPYLLLSTSPVVHTWVTSALRCNVQELVIEINLDWLYPNPIAISSLFNSKSLTFLRLVLNSYYGYPVLRLSLGLQLPDSVCLPSLKTLFLEKVIFWDDCDGIYKLVSSCPVLESLTTKYSWFPEYIKISSLSLKHLVFEDNQAFGVKLITPNLISFKCNDYTSKRYYLEDISSLIKADICMCQYSQEEYEYGDDDDEYIRPEVKKKRRAQRMLEFLRAFRNVQDLTLSGSFFEVLCGSLDLLEVEPTKLCYLTCLRLKTFLSRETIPAIANLLNISPEIKSLFVEIGQISSGSSNIGEYPEAETSSQCLLDNLELVEIRDAVGCVNELYFIELLLKNAKVLKKMVVYTSKKDSPEREERLLKFKEQLLTFPKASSVITILFI